MPHTQDTNFNYYQVLNLLRAGSITLSDAAKRLNIHEKTLGAYLSTTITPKKPRLSITPSTSSLNNDPAAFGMVRIPLFYFSNSLILFQLFVTLKICNEFEIEPIGTSYTARQPNK